MAFIRVLGQVMKHVSATVTESEPRINPPRCAAGCVSWYSSLSRFERLINIPRL